MMAAIEAMRQNAEQIERENALYEVNLQVAADRLESYEYGSEEYENSLNSYRAMF
ncbi:MAG: hypothetical protein J6N51_15520 [Selenomonas sp.]|nr:hypothetical protein [Selenomonas sp.]